MLYVRKIEPFIHSYVHTLSTHPVKSNFSVVVPVYKILVIDEAFFSFLQALPGKAKKCLFSVSFSNFEGNFFNTIMQLINPNYAWKNSVKRIKATQ